MSNKILEGGHLRQDIPAQIPVQGQAMEQASSRASSQHISPGNIPPGSERVELVPTKVLEVLDSEFEALQKLLKAIQASGAAQIPEQENLESESVMRQLARDFPKIILSEATLGNATKILHWLQENSQGEAPEEGNLLDLRSQLVKLVQTLPDEFQARLEKSLGAAESSLATLSKATEQPPDEAEGLAGRIRRLFQQSAHNIREIEQGMRNFLEGQFTKIQDSSEQIQARLSAALSDSSYAPLLHTLELVAQISDKDLLSAKDKELRNFASTLKEVLQRLILEEQAGQTNTQMIKQLLVQSYTSLHEQFALLEKNTDSWQELLRLRFTPSPQLSPPSQMAARALEAQLKLILAQPEQATLHLEGLRALFEQLHSIHQNSIHPNSTHPTSTAHALEELFFQKMGSLAKQTQDLLKNPGNAKAVLEFARTSLVELELLFGSAERSVSRFEEQSLQAVLSSLKEMLPQTIPPLPEQALLPTAYENAQFRRLLHILHERGAGELFRLLHTLHEELALKQKTGTQELAPSEKALLRLSAAGMHDLEKSIDAGLKETKEVVQAIRAELQKMQIQRQQLTPHREFSSDVLQAVQRLDQVLRGQEVLQQFQPLLQAAGEPVLLLFPTLYQGFFSQLEILYRQRNAGADKENAEHDSDSGQAEDICLQLHLPSLGKIQVHGTHHQGKLQLEFTSEDDKRAEFLSRHLHLLTQRFEAQGFQEPCLRSKTGKRVSEDLLEKSIAELGRSNALIA